MSPQSIIQNGSSMLGIMVRESGLLAYGNEMSTQSTNFMFGNHSGAGYVILSCL